MKFIKDYFFGIATVLVFGVLGFFLYTSCVGYYFYPFEGLLGTFGRALVYSFMSFFVFSVLRRRWNKTKLEFWIFCLVV
jgi:hypothetical protein